MSTFGRVAAGVAAGALVLGLGTMSAGAARPIEVELVGEATCVLDQGEGWSLEYALTDETLVPSSTGPAVVYGVEILSAELSGALTGPVSFSPTTLTEGETATAGVYRVPNSTVGTVTLTVEVSPTWADYSDTVSLDLELDGSCVSPATTVAPTTTTTTAAVEPAVVPGPDVAAVAVAATPAFTG